jgi:hypothetical protein
VACGDDKGSANGLASGAWSAGEIVLAVDALGLAVPGVTVNITEAGCGGTLLASGVTDADGRVSFSGLGEDWVHVQVVGDAGIDVIDSWTYHIKVGDPLWSGNLPIPIPVVAGGAARIVEQSAMFVANPNAGPIVGSVFEGTGPGDRTFVGCVTVQLADDPTNDTVRYFGAQDLPNSAATETSSINGRFYVGNASAGEHTINVIANGQTIGSETICVKPRSVATTTEGNVFLTGVYLPIGTPPVCN